jgi:Bacterial mobilisation protein (MobC)
MKKKNYTKLRALRFTEQEEKVIFEKMASLGFKNFSQYARRRILENGEIVFSAKTAGVPRLTDKNLPIISAINKVGVNVNQIAKVLNENRATSHPIATEESNRVLREVLDQLLIIAKSIK